MGRRWLVVTADIIGSRHIEPRQALRATVVEALEACWSSPEYRPPGMPRIPRYGA